MVQYIFDKLWFPCSLELNPTEHLWYQYKRSVRFRRVQPPKLQDARLELTEEYKANPQPRISKHLYSMQERHEAIFIKFIF